MRMNPSTLVSTLVRTGLVRTGLIAATALTAALYCGPLAYSQESQPVITLAKSFKPLKAQNAEVLAGSGAAMAGGGISSEASAARQGFRENYREFSRAKVAQASEPEFFQFDFHGATKLGSISASAEFRVLGGTCIEGHIYGAGDVCNVEVTLTAKGPGHRTGQLSVAHSGSATPFLVPIGGTAYGPAISFIPSQIQTVTGTYSAGGTLLNPGGLAIDGGDSLYIADTGNNLIKFRDSSGTIVNLVGGGTASAVGYSGFGSGIKLNGPRGVAVDYSGTFYIADTGDSVVLVRYIDGILNTRIGGGVTGSSCSFASPCLPYNVKITPPYAVATDSSGNLYTTLQVGGSLPGFYLAENEADNNNYYLLNTTAYNYYSTSPALAVDPYGNLFYTYEDPGGPLLSPTPLCYVLGQNRAYSTSTAGQRFWTVAGSGKCGFSGDGGRATGAEISTSIGQFAFDAAGNFYFADTGNNRVRRVDAVNGVIRTVAGNGSVGFSGDGGPSTSAPIQAPLGLAVDSNGRVYATGAAGTAPRADIRMFGTVGALNFGNQVAKTHGAAQAVVISNVGNDTLNFTHVGFGPGNTSDFAVDPNTTSCNFTAPLLAGHSCNVSFFFTPGDTGARATTFIMTDDTIGGVNTIQLAGTGVGTATLTPTTIAFPSTKVGASSAAVVVKLTNTGTIALTIGGVPTFTGAGATSFKETTTCGTTLAAAANCTISVVFAPLSVGNLAANLVVKDGTATGQQTVALTGVAVAAAAAKPVLTPTTQTFTSQQIGTASAVHAIKLSNTGTAALAISSFSLSGANPGDFSFTQNCGTSVAVAGSCTIDVTFKPTIAGTRSASLSIIGSTGALSVVVTGMGVNPAKAALSPVSLTFASQTAGTASAAKVVTLSNSGGVPLTISSYVFSGTNATDFTQTHTCGTSLAAATSCTLSVVFKPAAAGARSGKLTVNSSAGAVAVTLAGPSVAAAVKAKVTLTSKANPVSVGQSVLLTSSVVSIPGAKSTTSPTGAVQLREGSRVWAQAELSSGTVSFTLANLPVGTHTLNAIYMGDKDHGASTSTAVQQMVARTIRLPHIGKL